MTNLLFSFSMTLLVAFGLNFHLKHSIPFGRNILRYRIAKTVGLVALILIWLWSLNLQPLAWFGLLLLIPAIYSYGVTIKDERTPHLLCVPSMRKDTLHVHLRTVETNFSLDVYRDLITLIEIAPSQGITCLILTSPLLAKSGRFRHTGFLEKMGVTVSDKTRRSAWLSPFTMVSLMYKKHLMQCPSLKRADLSCQYRLILTINADSIE